MSFPCLLQVGFTSAPGQGGILAQRDFDRRFSPHFVSACPLIMEKCTRAAAAECGGLVLVHGVCGLLCSHLESSSWSWSSFLLVLQSTVTEAAEFLSQLPV